MPRRRLWCAVREPAARKGRLGQLLWTRWHTIVSVPCRFNFGNGSLWPPGGVGRSVRSARQAAQGILAIGYRQVDDVVATVPVDNDASQGWPVLRSWLGRLTVFVLCVVLFLSVVPGSYDPLDWEIISGGVSARDYPGNWMGLLGAELSHWGLLLFGLALYPVLLLGLLASLRRLVWRRGLRPVRWDYWIGLLLVLLGTAMLLGIWPGLCADWTDALNLRGLPGGAIGQRLSAPGAGLMRVILNATGTALVASALVLAGLVVVWVHDWHHLVWPWLRAGAGAVVRSSSPVSAAVEPAASAASLEAAAPAAPSSGLAERRRRRQPEPESPQQPQFDLAAGPPPLPPPPVRAKAAAPAPAAANAAPTASRSRSAGAYQLPSLKLLHADAGSETFGDPADVEYKKKVIQETLDSFGIDAQVGNATCGPRVTLYEVVPAPGVKVERISRLANNISMDLRSTNIRILTPIPGRKSVGIEVPNAKPSRVSVHSLMDSPAWQSPKARIPLLLGRSISGEVVILDLEKAPHLLIAGATGSGKSVCINLMILSLLCRFSPEELRLIMVDPKVVEFRAYGALPHLITPVISKVEQVPLALRWVIREMERRYRVLAKVGARNLESFNARPAAPEVVLDDDGEPIPPRLPHIVVIIDELADIMMTAKGDVETALARLAQMSRAVGIHAILATQRPSVNVITGIIKANFPTRIAFKVTSQVDSRTILDCKGAETLLGQGDMLYRPPGAASLQRNQGGMVEDDEIERVTAFIAEQAAPEFDSSVLKGVEAAVGAGAGGAAELEEGDEALVQQATEIILRDRRATTSYLQRAMRIGYNKSASIIDILEQRGVIGPQVGSAPREILVDGGGRAMDDGAVDGDEDLAADLDDDDTDRP